jgi:hypothetical protein
LESGDAHPAQLDCHGRPGAFDPEAFWLGWDRGSTMNVDTFGTGWDFWSVIHSSVAALRYAIPPLEPDDDATRALPTI